MRAKGKPRKERADPGLEIALLAADGVEKLASALGLAHSSVSVWKRIPAEHVLKVEKATGISREELRPDIYPLGPRRGRPRLPE
jgi:DNA-binding transcriptional regulator YdaS (Cro superfamily)